ncbi:hypothetical protein DUNSADRAFT_18060 [Dunaliella salina]|uniref:Uncharacterized protein n=1 Tax=Dunaliella salina TaxID=3046 RepID=A0ABQ7GZI5_DUNSA|nr:hypothetical protein DUNSADRAFT_18060 [Dunaliella salina]|eukprot:KAF5840023.1 hypothetical protein DUNSADRAFT_18060 [Dunaliella salina]
MSVHPDPGTTSALTSYAQMELPGTKLFSDFASSVVRRYCLDDIVLPKKVLSITPEVEEHYSDSPNRPRFSRFTLHLSDGSTMSARRVVVAVGSTNIPRIPSWAADLRGTPGGPLACSSLSSSYGGPDSGLSLDDVEAESCSGRNGSGEVKGAAQQQQQQQRQQQQQQQQHVRLPRGVVLHAWEVAHIFSRLGHHLQHDKQSAKKLESSSQSDMPVLANAVSSYKSSSSSSSSSSSNNSSDHFNQGSYIGPAQAAHSHCCSSESSSTEARACDCSLDSATQRDSLSSSGQGSSSACSLDSTSDCETCAPLPTPSSASSSLGSNSDVGGGLTAAQMALLAMKHCCKDCIILMRGALKIKQFDVDVGWLGRDRQRALKAFNGQLHEHSTNPSRLRVAQAGGQQQQQQQQADEGAVRLAVLKEATGGGSMSPEALRLLMPYIVAGHVKLVEHEEIIAAGWDDEFCWGGSGTGDVHEQQYEQQHEQQYEQQYEQQHEQQYEQHQHQHEQHQHEQHRPEQQGAWELLLACTGTCMHPKAVAKALREAETPPHMHGHNKSHHSRAHGHSHVHKSQGRHIGDSSSEEDLLERLALHLHVRSSRSLDSDHRWYQSAPPGITSEDGMLYAHHVWLATGSVVDVRAEPVFAGLMAATPVPVYGGMPMLQEDLRWQKDVDCFVLGAYAALRLGPGAANLMGARTAAVKVTAALKASHGGVSRSTGCSTRRGEEGARSVSINEGASGGVSSSGSKREREITGSISNSGSSSTNVTTDGHQWDAGKQDSNGGGVADAGMRVDSKSNILGGVNYSDASACRDANDGGDWLDQLHRVVTATRCGRAGVKEIKVCEDTRSEHQLNAAKQQHAELCKVIKAEAVTIHPILLGVGGTIYTEHTLKQFKQLGLDLQRAT